MRGIIFFAALAALAAPTRADNISDCNGRIHRTLAVMESMPLLKEEHATAIMWLRLDAEEAAAAGDIETCNDKIGTVETLLGIARTEE